MTNQQLRCSNVEITLTAISQIEGQRVILMVPRAGIRSIALGHESEVSNPFFQYFVGFMLLALGLIGLLVTFLANIGKGGLVNIKPGTVVIPIIPVILWGMIGIGCWLLSGIFRTRYGLSIDTENGTHKIYFEKRVTGEEIHSFLRMAQLKFGYPIDMSVLENK